MINYLLVFKPKGGENMSYGGSCGFGGGFAFISCVIHSINNCRMQCWGGGY